MKPKAEINLPQWFGASSTLLDVERMVLSRGSPNCSCRRGTSSRVALTTQVSRRTRNSPAAATLYRPAFRPWSGLRAVGMLATQHRAPLSASGLPS